MSGAGGVIELPAERCYWAVVDAVAGRGGSAALAYRFEDVLPMPVETLQVAATDLGDGRVLVVGIEREELAARWQPLRERAWRASPDGLPEHLAAAGIEAAAVAGLNLLHGAFEPPRRRRLRRALQVAVALAFAVGITLVLGGGLERGAAYRTASAELERRALALADAAAPQHAGAPQRHAQARLTEELRRARQAASEVGPQADLVPVLEALWRRWPRELRIQLDDLSLSPEQVTLHARVADAEAAAAFATALARLDAAGTTWNAQPLDLPRVDAEAAHLVLALEPAAGPEDEP